jgi:iron complex outermembrane recepter protein
MRKYFVRLRPPRRYASLKLIAVLAAMATAGQAQDSRTAAEIENLKEMTLDQLINVEVTSVARRPQALVEAPSAVQIITNEEIRRSGATSLPEALRLAGNLHVAQVDSRQWAISARGFNSTTASKMLFMIDGRRAYSPLFNGVFWDVQNVRMEDIERIEVVSGPGTSLWGANAVNGVINVIRKSAKDTQGVLVSGGAGSFLNAFGSARYGGKIGKDLYFRLYGMSFDRDSTVFSNGQTGTNDWSMAQGGFRTDWLPEHGSILTVQGDLYGGTINQARPGDISVDGQNLLARWTQPLSSESDVVLQLYWDRTWRRIPGTLAQDLNSYDLDFHHRFPFGERHRMMWGAGYRLMVDDAGNTPALGFIPEERELQIFSAFVQDEIALVHEKLYLTLGTKLEHNDYSGFELEPTVRLAWRMVPSHTLWAAVSHAVRSPSRLDTELAIPSSPPHTLIGGGELFDSEKLIAYELGYRADLNRRLTLSLSTFFHDYDELRSVEPIPGAPGTLIILNGLSAETYGAELSTIWRAADFWRLRFGYTLFEKDITVEAADVNRGTGEGNDPHHQFLLHSILTLPGNVEFDSFFRYVDRLNQPGPTVPSYFSLDLRLAVHPAENIEIALVGQNLLDRRHAEFGPVATRQEIPRSVYGKVTWRF